MDHPNRSEKYPDGGEAWMNEKSKIPLIHSKICLKWKYNMGGSITKNTDEIAQDPTIFTIHFITP